MTKINDNGVLKNIFLHDSSNINESQTTFAKIGLIEVRANKRMLVLYDGKTINNINGKISEFKFSKSDLDRDFTSNTTSHQKTQENSTLDLIKCILISSNLKMNFQIKEGKVINNCLIENLENIYKELYTRLIKPFYIIFLITISLLFILKSKTEISFNKSKIKIYIVWFFLHYFFRVFFKI